MTTKEREKAIKILTDKLKSEGSKIHVVKGDGDCLFRALAYALYLDTENKHAELRQKCCNYMVSNGNRARATTGLIGCCCRK